MFIIFYDTWAYDDTNKYVFEDVSQSGVIPKVFVTKELAEGYISDLIGTTTDDSTFLHPTPFKQDPDNKRMLWFTDEINDDETEVYYNQYAIIECDLIGGDST